MPAGSTLTGRYAGREYPDRPLCRQGDEKPETRVGGTVMIDKALVGVFIAVMLLVVGIQLMLTPIPLFRRIEFDAICHFYAQKMDHAGSLSQSDISQLEYDLAARGFTVVSLGGIWTAAFGDELSLSVQAACSAWKISGQMVLEEVQELFSYDAKLICRKMFDFGAVP